MSIDPAKSGVTPQSNGLSCFENRIKRKRGKHSCQNEDDTRQKNHDSNRNYRMDNPKEDPHGIDKKLVYEKLTMRIPMVSLEKKRSKGLR